MNSWFSQEDLCESENSYFELGKPVTNSALITVILPARPINVLVFRYIHRRAKCFGQAAWKINGI